jgi:hypothetical protein
MKLIFEPYISKDSFFVDKDSNKRRMTTFVVPWPTVKLAELRTHRTIYQTESEEFNIASNERTIAMNANSSRAIPLERQIKQVEEHPFEPVWTLNQSGMSGKAASVTISERASQQWHSARAFALTRVKALLDLGIHKQDAALLLNPFSWTTCILSADQDRWNHFFNLRCNAAVYPAVRIIAEKMESLMLKSTPVELDSIHIAFEKEAKKVVIDALESGEITAQDYNEKHKYYTMAVSMSMCAMISYDTQERSESLTKHVQRAKKLLTEGHWSTAEHQFIPVYYDNSNSIFKGWKSLREVMVNHESFAKDFLNIFNF